MNKKWLLMITSVFLAAMVSVGCNVGDDPDPAPPVDDNNETETPLDDNNNGNNNNQGDNNNQLDEGNVPGVDENDTMNKDDEKDADPDPEDLVEDPEDMGDRDRKDE